MALSASIVWEVRTSGNANNGGGFKAGASGNDYSQQDSAQYTPSSALTTSGASATILYAAASTDMVGNLINITGGTNFTTGRYEIVSVSAGVSITVDRNATSGVGAAGSGNIGGAVTLSNSITSVVAQGNTVWIKDSGSSHSITSTCGWNAQQNNSSNSTTVIAGYGSSRGDGTRPTITSATNSVHLMTPNADSVGMYFKHLKFTHTATTRGQAFNPGSNIINLTFEDCLFDGLSSSFDGGGSGRMFFLACEIKNCTSAGFTRNGPDALEFYRCWIHDNTSHGVALGGNQFRNLLMRHCIMSKNGGDGLNIAVSSSDNRYTVDSCVFYGNTSDGIEQTDTGAPHHLRVLNSIFYGNGGYGIKWQSTRTPDSSFSLNNAFGANTSGAYTIWPAGVSEVTLSANPFTDSTHDDYTLNGTAGGGAACKAVGSPQAIP